VWLLFCNFNDSELIYHIFIETLKAVDVIYHIIWHNMSYNTYAV